MAVKYGLPEYEALKAITINAARAAWLDDRVGSIEVGKDADIVVMDERFRVRSVYVCGELMHQA